MSDLSISIYIPTSPREDIMAPSIGDTIITSASGIVGVVQEVVLNGTGSWRVRIAHDGGEKWTTVQP